MPGEGFVVWIAGTSWDAPVPGTDRRLATEVAREIPVLWVDPPRPWRPADGRRTYRLSRITEGMARLVVVAPPGLTRQGVRRVTAALLARAVRGALIDLGRTSTAVLTSFPLAIFPRGVAGTRVLYVTDDWLGGSRQLGFSFTAVRTTMTRNMQMADIVAAVSPVLAATLDAMVGGARPDAPRTRVLANGCPRQDRTGSPAHRAATAGVVGQLNERLDLDALEAVRDTGVEMTLIGPRVEATRVCRVRLDALLRSSNVTWSGRLPPSQVAWHLDRLGAGLTPYADTPFNRASFPLKTLEYLASGLGVVSTDLPSVRWLASDLVAVGRDPSTFADLVTKAVANRHDGHQEQRRRNFAARHTWEARASELMEMIEAPATDSGIIPRRPSGQPKKTGGRRDGPEA